jgi:hypothetical protein
MADRAMSEFEIAGERSGDATRRSGIGFARNSPADAQALDRVRTWTRERFKLADEVPIVVAEIACGLPGCPPLETVVAFWTADRRPALAACGPSRGGSTNVASGPRAGSASGRPEAWRNCWRGCEGEPLHCGRVALRIT